MEREIYGLVHATENSWWYKGRTLVIKRALSPFLKVLERERGSRVLDIGSGDGGMHSFLKTLGIVSALETDEESASLLSQKGYEHIIRSDTELRNYPKLFDVAGGFDVLEHIEDEQKFLGNIKSCLAADGLLVLTVPAFQFLWSNHDVAAHHFRRYTKKQITNVLEDASFKVLYASYWNCLMFLPAMIVRMLGFSGWSGLGRGGLFDKVILLLVKAESRFMPRLPFGTGIVVVAKKSGA